MDFTQNIDHLWLIAGGLLIIFEFILLPGVGFLFAGLGAITIGTLLALGIMPDSLWQWVFFLGFTLAWAVLLWKPLKSFRMGKNEKPFSDMAGQKAVVTSSILPGQTGKARWSGTIMKAKAEDPSLTLVEGAEVVIIRAEGNVLIIR